MPTPFTPLRKAANDLPNPGAKRAALPQIQFSVPAIGSPLALTSLALALFLGGAGCGYTVSELSHSHPASAVTPTLPSPQPAQANLHPVAAQVQPQADIALPAENLASDDTLTAVEKTAPQGAINIVADKISDLPAINPASNAANAVTLSSPGAMSREQLLGEAHVMIADNDMQSALTVYDNLLASDPNDRTALSGKAFTLARMGEYGDAAKIGHQILKLDPNDEAARNNLIAALGASGEPDASGELKRMIAARPDDARLHAALAQQAVRKNNDAEALRRLDQAIRLQPDSLNYRLDLAILYDRGGYSGEALALYQQVLRMLAATEAPPALPLPTEAIQQRIAYLQVNIQEAQ